MGFSALVLDPVLESRSRFKKLAEDHSAFDRCVASSTLSEGMHRLSNVEKKWDAVYISTRFDPLVVSRFIVRARNTEASADAANLIMVSRDSTNTSMKQFEMGHPDGYLLEPIIAKDLNGSVKFLKNFVEQRDRRRQAAQEPINYRALCARLAVAVDKGKPGLKDRREISAKLKEFSPEQRDQFYLEMTEYFSNIEMPLLDTLRMTRP
jgi:DNA-binding response OmpR family regulator